MSSRGPAPWLAALLVAGAAGAGAAATAAPFPVDLASLGLAVALVLLSLPLAAAAHRSDTARPPRPTDGPSSDTLADRADAVSSDARGGATPSPERLHELLDLLRRAADADAAILLGPPADEDGTLRVIAAAPGGDPLLRAAPFPASGGLPGAVLREEAASAAVVGAPVERTCPYAEPGRAVVHALGQPVSFDGRSGVLVLERRRNEAFGPEAAAATRGAAQLVSWLFAAEDVSARALHRVAALECMADAAHALATADDAAAVSHRTIAAARALVPVDAAVVALRDDTGEAFFIVAAEGCDLAPPAPFPRDAGLVGRAVALRETLPAHGRQSATSGPPFGPSLPWTPPAGAALAVVPLVGGEAVGGVLVLSASAAPPYDRAQQLLLRSLGNLAGAELTRRGLERSLAALARTDPLTGLANRRAFDDALAAALGRSERYGHPTSLLLLDLDHFKRVNDTYGHATGDLVLQAVSKSLQTLARDVDVPARIGGEELAVILEHTAAGGARNLAERLRERVRRIPFPHDAGTFHVTVSIGVATWGVHGSAAAPLVAAADAALYAAKDAGRDRVAVAPDGAAS